MNHFRYRTARRIGTVGNRPVYRYPILVRLNRPMGTIEDWTDPPEIITDCISTSPMEAARWVAQMVDYRPHTEIIVRGPKGGSYTRVISMDRWVMHNMMKAPAREDQLCLL